MQEPVDQTTWAKKLETGLEAITFLEINDPTNVINEAVDNLFKNWVRTKAPVRPKSKISALMPIGMLRWQGYATTG